jgi:hypothetical protein
MSDRPLFENEDAQERVYAPQELPTGTDGRHEAAVEETERGAGGAGPGVIVPGAVTAFGGQPGSTAVSTTGSGDASMADAAIAGAAVSPRGDRDDDSVVETDEARGS